MSSLIKDDCNMNNDSSGDNVQGTGTGGEEGGGTGGGEQVPKKETKTSDKISERIDQVSTTAFSKIFGDSYSKRECSFVLLAGALIAFNMGFVNGNCVSGFLTPTQQTQSVSGFSSSFTQSAIALAESDYEEYGYHICLILSYMLGSFLCAFITPKSTPYQIEPTYGPTFMIGGIMLFIASSLAAIEFEPKYIFYLTAGANGIQNGIASLYSANLIRCSLTGSITDIALVLAQCLRGNQKHLWKGFVLLSIIGNFWLGGLFGFYFSRQFLTVSLFFNAVLFWFIGMGLIFFLVLELRISFRAAILGTWKWKKALKSLSVSLQQESQQYDARSSSVNSVGLLGGHNNNMMDDAAKGGRSSSSSNNLLNMFDIIDHDGNGQIDAEELLTALIKANAKIDGKGIMVLIKYADANGDGMINREEWSEIVRKIES